MFLDQVQKLVKYVSLANFIRIAVTIPLLLASLLIYLLLERFVGEDRSFDLLTISYQESELRGKRLHEIIRRKINRGRQDIQANMTINGEKMGVYKLRGEKLLRVFGTLNLKGFSYDLVKEQIASYPGFLSFFEFGGQILALAPVPGATKSQIKNCRGEEQCLFIVKVDFHDIFRYENGLESTGIDYIINRSGKLIYSSSAQISAANYYKRKLVQSFIEGKATSQQWRFKNRHSNTTYGYFHIIADTNLVLFREIPEEHILLPISDLGLTFAFYFIVLTVIFLVLINPFVLRAVRPLENLVRVIQEVMKGRFENRLASTGFGEISLLVDTYNQMGSALQNREQEINRFHLEEIERLRLESDFNFAKTVQKTMLEIGRKQKNAHIHVYYRPGDELSGDWYGVYRNPKTLEHVGIVCDVSGKGLASSMFTTIIAGVFYDLTLDDNVEKFDFEAFCQAVNDKFFFFGKSNWYTTFSGISFVPGSGSLDVYNVGHPQPLICKDGKIEPMTSGENVLGLTEEVIKMTHIYQNYQANDKIFLYSDGLLKMRNSSGKQFGMDGLKRSIANSVTESSTKSMDDLISSDIETFQEGGGKIDEDICLMRIVLE